MMIRKERAVQHSVFSEAATRAGQDYRWGLLMAIPNGQYRAGQAMEPGLKAGVPDIFLPVAAHGFHGLWIELKVGDNEADEKQVRWMKALANEGYAVWLVRDYAQDAIDIIGKYLRGDYDFREFCFGAGSVH